MRIIIDAQPLLEPLAGIGRYASSFLKALGEIDSENDYFLYYGASLKQSRANLPHFDNPNFHNKLIKFSGKAFRLLTEKLHMLPVGAFLKDYDIFHGLNYYAPHLSFPSIVNIYDLSYVLFSDCFTKERLRDIRYKVGCSIKRTEKIITGSESTKSDIIRFLNVAGEKIEVTRFGLEEKFHPVDNEELIPIREKYHLPERFILFVGTIEPRKNILNLVHAFHRLGRDAGLVIAGRKGWLFKEIFKEVRWLNLGERIIFLDYVPETDLPLLYNAASVFVYPSLYEGFGFPPLEAMACGVPVITSDKSSLPEIVGDAGILINPEDTGEIREAIISVLDDGSLRRKMVRKGLKRAKQFSWKKCAEETLKLYREVA
jgi:glycosyltransferase involved in cell wall biosynthesis